MSEENQSKEQAVAYWIGQLKRERSLHDTTIAELTRCREENDKLKAELADATRRLSTERTLADMLATALTHYTDKTTLSDPDWWDYHGQGGAPERCDLIETDISEPARSALTIYQTTRNQPNNPQ